MLQHKATQSKAFRVAFPEVRLLYLKVTETVETFTLKVSLPYILITFSVTSFLYVESFYLLSKKILVLFFDIYFNKELS